MSEPAVPAIEELLRHTRWVEELARRLVRDPEAARDVAQSAWAVLLRAPPRRDARAWLGRVVRNLARERHKREAQRAAVERAGARAEALPSTTELLARTEAERRLVEAVTALEEPHRSTLLLRYFEGLATSEIARREGVAAAIVAHRITRAHARLRQDLERKNDGLGWLAAVAPILLRAPHMADSNMNNSSTLTASTTAKILLAAAIAVTCAFLWIHAKNGRVSEVPQSLTVAQAAGPTSAPIVEPDAQQTGNALVAPEAAVARSAAPIAAAAPPVVPEPAPSVRGGRIHGVVFRPDGAVAASRRVRFLHMLVSGLQGAGEHYVTTDADGRFDEHDLVRGTWSIATWPSDDELTTLGTSAAKTLGGMLYLAERTIGLEDGSDVEVKLGAMPDKPIRVHGYVISAGKPLDFSVLQWLPVGEDFHSRARNSLPEQGSLYSVVLETPGPYIVSCILGGARTEWRIDVPAQPDVEHDFEVPTGVVHGVVHTADGRPIVSATVEISARGGAPSAYWMTSIGRSKRTDASGKFAFEALENAHWAIAVMGGSAPGESDLAAAQCVRDVVAEPAEHAHDLEITAEIGVRVPLRFVGTDDKERSGYAFVFDANGEPLNALSGLPNGKKGAWTTPPLAPGRYSIVGEFGFLWSTPHEFVVDRRTDPARIDLRLEPGAQIDVDVSGVESAYLDVRDSAGRRFGSMCDPSLQNRAVERDLYPGRVRMRLSPGTYEITAIGRDGPLKRATVAARADEVVRVALQ